MTMITTDWQDALREQDACLEAMDFAAGFESFQAAWDACERGDWMLWWIGKTSQSAPMSPKRRPLVKVACSCARIALPYVKAGDDRPRLVIELAERWANGDNTVTRPKMRAAYAASYAAAAAYASSAAAYASYAAAYAAYAAAYADASAASSAASYAASAAASADASAASSAASAAASADAARSNILKQCADLIRAEYPHPPQVTR